MANRYSSAQFLDIIANHQESNVYFIHGEDHFLSDKIITQLIKRFTTPEGKDFDLISLFGEDIKSENIIEQLEMFPFLSEYKVVVVKGFEQLKEKDQTKVAEYISKIPSTSILIVHSETADARKKVFKAFDKYITINSKNPAGYWEIENWLSAELRRLKLRASRDTISLFSAKIEADYYTAYNELEKLLIYIGNRKEITSQDVETCMENNRANSIFELQNSIGNRDMKKALTILHNYLEAEEGKNSILLIVMLTRFFQIIWKVRYLQVQKFSNSEIQSNYLNEVHSSFRSDYINFANNYSRIKMSHIFDLLLQADYKLKSTDIVVNVLLTKLVIDLIS